MAFPSSPTGGQQYTQDGRTWQWDGVAWEVLAVPGPTGPAGAPGVVAATAPLAYNSGTQTVSIDLSAYSTTAAANGLYYPLSGNPSSFLVASALTPYLTSATAASTYAPLASPTFTGTVTIPAGASISGFAPLASPALSGTPTAPTATASTNTTQVATTAFVVGQAGTAAPLVNNGSAVVGTSLLYSRQDHVHPTDTTRAALASPTFTGTPLSTTAAAGDYSTQIGTTEYALKATFDPCMHKVVNDDWSASTSGTGSTTQQNGDLKTAIGPTAIGYARMSQGLQLTSVGVGQDDSIDWSKKIYFSGRVMMLRGSASNLIYRVNLGDNFNSGDPANRCIALKCTPNATALQLQVHNGTTLTTVNSSFTPTIGATFDFLIVSNAGTVTLFVNRSQVASTTSGPTNRAGSYYYNAMTICCENTTGTNGYAEMSLVNQSAYFTP